MRNRTTMSIGSSPLMSNPYYRAAYPPPQMYARIGKLHNCAVFSRESLTALKVTGKLDSIVLMARCLAPMPRHWYNGY